MNQIETTKNQKTEFYDRKIMHNKKLGKAVTFHKIHNIKTMFNLLYSIITCYHKMMAENFSEIKKTRNLLFDGFGILVRIFN